ncbi:MAG: hypothetical protein KGJ93_04405 [Patescibacteria group bacterium]|nr:hypothetical protein [Patescibacteria group bacterium]
MPEFLNNKPEIDALKTLESVLETHALDFAEQDVFVLINQIKLAEKQLAAGGSLQQAELDKLSAEVYKFIKPDTKIN